MGEAIQCSAGNKNLNQMNQGVVVESVSQGGERFIIVALYVKTSQRGECECEKGRRTLAQQREIDEQEFVGRVDSSWRPQLH